MFPDLSGKGEKNMVEKKQKRPAHEIILEQLRILFNDLKAFKEAEGRSAKATAEAMTKKGVTAVIDTNEGSRTMMESANLGSISCYLHLLKDMIIPTEEKEKIVNTLKDICDDCSRKDVKEFVYKKVLPQITG